MCLQTCVHPVQLPCNHIFCFLCVKGVLANQRRRCALCRKDIPAEFLDNPKLVTKPGAPTPFDAGYASSAEASSSSHAESSGAEAAADASNADDAASVAAAAAAGTSVTFVADSTTSSTSSSSSGAQQSASTDSSSSAAADTTEATASGTTAASSASASGAFQWFYEGFHGWWQYDERTSGELEDAHRRGNRKLELLIAGFIYVIDFENMWQYRRNDPSKRRRIKRDLSSISKKGIAGIRIQVIGLLLWMLMMMTMITLMMMIMLMMMIRMFVQLK